MCSAYSSITASKEGKVVGPLQPCVISTEQLQHPWLHNKSHTLFELGVSAL